MQQSGTSYLTGAICGFAAVSIWAGWSAITRLAVTTGLDAWDIAALRFGVAGLLLLPVVLRCGLARDRLGWSGLVAIVIGGGVPYVLLVAADLRFAPAHHQAALNPGFMPLFVAVIAAVFLRERLSRPQKLGLSLIAAAALLIVGWPDADRSTARAWGHTLFLSAALLWAYFTVIIRRAWLDSLHAAALVCTGSALLYLPVYLALHGGARLARLAPAEFAFQSVFQGVLVTILSLVLYARAIALLGASAAAAFGALVPALSALLAIPLLGKWPSPTDWLAIALVSVGVYLTSGGPWPRPIRWPGNPAA